jgi:serine phosphatase RsbU (regulator of sigma subunit)/anti-sigma regulatory factor (Ser/Thr protein kinase)
LIRASMDCLPLEDSLSAIAPVAAWVDAAAVEAGLSTERRDELQVCLEEVLANLILHGQPRKADKSIRVAISTSEGSVVVRVLDSCEPFDPRGRPRPEETEFRIGGRGLRLIESFAPGLAYSTDAEGNELIMTFRDTAAEIDAPVIEALGKVRAFADLPPSVLKTLADKATPLAFAPGERLLSQGEISDFALVLIEGEVAVVDEHSHGDAQVGRIEAPALFGEIGALAQLPRTAGARAITAVKALRLEHSVLVDAARHAPEILVSVIGQLGRQIRAVNSALGLYAAGLAALERDDFDVTVLEELSNPTSELASFAAAFQALARRVMLERRHRSEMASAALIQRAMLPGPFDRAALAGRCEVFGAMTPAREVGGDLYDLFMLDDRRLALVVGDVCGKGVPASLFMCVTVTALRMAAQACEDTADVVAQANRILSAQNDMSMFSTLFYAVLDLDTHRLEYVNCGHNPPILLPASGGHVVLPGRGVPVGLFPDRRWPAHALELNQGDRLFLFTDGVTEAADPAEAEYGDERLLASLEANRGLDPAGLVEAVMADVAAFTHGAEPSDDITCVAALLI